MTYKLNRVKADDLIHLPALRSMQKIHGDILPHAWYQVFDPMIEQITKTSNQLWAELGFHNEIRKS